MRRTDYCGLMTEADIGKDAVACGWVANKRDMGGVIFIDLVDHTGVLQMSLIRKIRIRTLSAWRKQCATSQ